MTEPLPVDSRTDGEQQASDSDAGHETHREPIVPVNGNGSTARVRWGKAIKSVVATDGVQVTPVTCS